MESSSELVGEVVCLPGGVRVRIESIEGDPPSAQQFDGLMDLWQDDRDLRRLET
jgi:hypothetical protein